MSVEQPLDPETVEAAKAHIRGAMAQVAELSRSGVEPGVFFDQFLASVIASMAAAGGAVWKVDENGTRLDLLTPRHLPATGIPSDEEGQRCHAQLLGRAMAGNQPVLVQPGPWTGEEGEPGNPTSYLLLLAPLRTPRSVYGLVEVFQRSGAAAQSQRGYVKFLAQMTDLAMEYLRAWDLQQLSQREALWDRLDRYGQRVHRSLDLNHTVYAVANESRALIECDRVSVVIRRRRRSEVLAVSGQDVVEKRSNVVSLLRTLAERVIASRQPLWYTGETSELPPQLAEACHDYIDETHTRTLGIVPLLRPEPPEAEDDTPGSPEVFGAVVVEQIDQEVPVEQLRQRTEMVVRRASRALLNALDHDRVFLMPLWRVLGKMRWFVEARRLPWTVTIGALLVAAVTALCIIPADFKIAAQGTLQPFQRQDVFVQEPGVVDKVRVDHGTQVTDGQELVKLRSRELEVELAEVSGQQRATEEQLNSVRTAEGAPRVDRDERNRLSGQRAQLQKTLESLNKQLELLETRQKLLSICSPINGEVVTWDVRKRLEGRPVDRGQVLLAVADPTQKWELELLVPEAHAGFVTAAWNEVQKEKENETDEKKKDSHKLWVQYILATDPAQPHWGEVVEIQQCAEVRGDEGNTVLLRVKIKSDELGDVNRRPGAAVTGRILCGRRSVGYVWFHDVLAFIRAKILFRL